MCRIATYIGPPISIENIVTGPCHSLLSQSRHAAESVVELNGDGFGVAWYGRGEKPGLYRECLPAWSDENLINLCHMVESPLFIGHVRASTVGETMRTNCHPFSHDRWCFAHNGQIGGFPVMQRELEALLSDELYNARRGTTDSELLFLLLMQHDMNNAATSACKQVIRILEEKRKTHDIAAPLRLTFVFSNGHKLFGVRYASDNQCPTLYLSGPLDNGGLSLSSEPLDGNTNNWTMLEPSTLVEISSGNTAVHPLDITL